MAEKNTGVPPANLSGISRPGRGAAVVKPKNMKGTLGRLWSLTKGRLWMDFPFICSGILLIHSFSLCDGKSRHGNQ